jgi:outer membrane protein assembly factor BamD (BamD/ComL family)
MPIRISRTARRGTLILSFSWLAVSCAPTTPVRPAETSSTETTLANADAALERGEYPAAAKAYREAAERSPDEQVAEQATRVAFDHDQLREAALASARWLVLNPTSENAQRYAGLVALKLHRLDDAERQFGNLLDSVYISPAAGFLALPPVIGDEAVPGDVMELF